VLLSDILAEHVEPRSGDGLPTLLLRADQGARITGALVAAATAHGPEAPRLAGSILSLMERTVTGLWMYNTRLCMLERAVSGGAASAWAGLTAAHLGVGERCLDRWLTGYEVSLRHGGFSPPREVAERHRHDLAEGLGRLCQELVARDDAKLEGEGADTRAWGQPCAPFLELVGGQVHLWERRNRQHATWRVLPGGTIRAAARERAEVGAWRHLMSMVPGEPLQALTGEGSGVLPPGHQVIVRPVAGELLLAAQRLARELRRPDRPALVAPLAPGESDLGAVVGQVVPVGRDPVAGLRGWSGARPVLIVFGPADGDALVRLGEQARGVCRLVAVVPAWAPERWRPLSRRELRVEAEAGDDGMPSTVRAVVATDDVARWAIAAVSELGLGTEEGRSALHSLSSAMACPLTEPRGLVWRWWSDGHLAADAAGRLAFRHPGWRALAAGMLNGPCPEGDEAPWAAGRRLHAGDLR
jgi:hypothetical protein